jgi:MFS family permease
MTSPPPFFDKPENKPAFYGEVQKWKRDIIPETIPGKAKMFLAGSVLSGLGDGITMTIAQLYFISLGFTSSELGSIFMLKAIGTALVTLPAGYLADRFGKRKILMAGFGVFSIGIVMLLVTQEARLLSIAMFLIGLADATYVVLGPLYSSFFSNEDMDRAFGLRGFLRIISTAVGSLLGFVPPMLVSKMGISYTNAYWIMFAFACIFFFARLPYYLKASSSLNGVKLGTNLTMSKESKSILIKFVIIAVLGTVGYEVFFSFFPLFLNTKYNAESDALGLLFSLSWAASALANIVSPKISSKIGTVNTITLAYAICVPLYLGMAWAPTISVVAAIYLVRRAIANLASPLTSSLMMKTISEKEKATASGVTITGQKLGSAFSTWFGSWLITSYSIDAPIYVGAALYIAYSITMYILFGGIVKKTQDTPQLIEL